MGIGDGARACVRARMRVFERVRVRASEVDGVTRSMGEWLSAQARARVCVCVCVCARTHARTHAPAHRCARRLAADTAVLRHRIGLTYEAEAEEITSETIITEILNTLMVP